MQVSKYEMRRRGEAILRLDDEDLFIYFSGGSAAESRYNGSKSSFKRDSAKNRFKGQGQGQVRLDMRNLGYNQHVHFIGYILRKRPCKMTHSLYARNSTRKLRPKLLYGFFGFAVAPMFFAPLSSECCPRVFLDRPVSLLVEANGLGTEAARVGAVFEAVVERRGFDGCFDFPGACVGGKTIILSFEAVSCSSSEEATRIGFGRLLCGGEEELPCDIRSRDRFGGFSLPESPYSSTESCSESIMPSVKMVGESSSPTEGLSRSDRLLNFSVDSSAELLRAIPTAAASLFALSRWPFIKAAEGSAADIFGVTPTPLDEASRDERPVFLVSTWASGVSPTPMDGASRDWMPSFLGSARASGVTPTPLVEATRDWRPGFCGSAFVSGVSPTA